MNSNTTPIQHFFGQTQHGESRWWSWVITFWFALVIWFYGQMVLGLCLQVFALIVTPEVMLPALESAQTDININMLHAILYLLLGLSPIIPILLWLFRKSIKKSLSQKIAIGVSVLIMLSTTAGFIAANSNTGIDSEKFTTSLITAHPVLYALILLTFPVLAGGFWLGQKFVHRRTILSLHTAAKSFRWKRMGFSMIIVWIIMAAITFAGNYTGISPAKLVFDPSRFWLYLPVTLLLIPLQSATEEIALRGYLNQGLGHYIRNPWIVFFITSAAFASLHLGNPEIVESTKETPLIIAISGYFFFGMFACILTYIDGGLESAIGMHAANNIFAASILGYDNSALPTPTIFKTGLNTELDALMVLVSLSLVCLIMYKTREQNAFNANSL